MEVADFTPRSQIHLAAGQLLVAVDEFQQRRFPLPVAAHDADAVALANLQRLVVEDFAVEPFKGLGASSTERTSMLPLSVASSERTRGLRFLGTRALSAFNSLLHALNRPGCLAEMDLSYLFARFICCTAPIVD